MKYPVQKYSIWISGEKTQAENVEAEIARILADHGFSVQEVEFEGEIK